MQSQSRLRAIVRTGERCARQEHGGTLVEFGFSAVLMLGLVMGIMQLSMAMYAYHCVSDAARDGTRYAMVRGSGWGTSCDTGNAGTGYANSGCTASSTDITNYVENAGFLNGNGGSMTVTPQCGVLGGTLVAYGSTCNGSGNVVQVQVSYPFSFGIPGLPRYTYQLSSTSQQVISY